MEDPPNWHEITLSIYRCAVIVTWEPSLDAIIARSQHAGVDTITPEWTRHVREALGGGCTGYCTSLGEDNPDVLVWLKRRPTDLATWGVLYHELYHAVDHVAKDHGLEEEREARAYVFEYLVTAMHRALWSKA